MMKNTIKIFKIIAIVALIAILAGCKSRQLDYLETDSVNGPRQVRQGEDIDPRLITVWGVYKDGSRKLVNVTAGNIVFNKHAPGPQTVKVRVSNQETSFQTEVMELRSLTVTSQTGTILLKFGLEADRNWPGIEIRGEWNQMGTQRIPITSCQVTGFNKDQAGRQTVWVTYEGMRDSFDVEVRAMSSIQIAQYPTKIDYLQGETLNLTGLMVVGVWDGLPSEDLSITLSDVTGFNADNVGIQRLTVTKNGRAATFNIDIWRLTGIVLDKPPNKTDYTMGEQLDLTGIIVNGNYAGSTADKRMTVLIPINQLTVSGYNPNTIGRQQRVSVMVGGQTANFFVNVELPSAAASQ